MTVGDRCVVGVTVKLTEPEELANGTMVWVDTQAVTTSRRVVPVSILLLFRSVM